MDEFWPIALTFLVSIVASGVSAFVGGGGGLIMTPYLLLIGLPPVQAVATGKFGGAALAAASLRKFKGKGQLRKDILPSLLIITVTAAIIGPYLTLSINEELIPKLVGAVLLVALAGFLKREIGIKQHESSSKRRSIGYVLIGLISVVQAAIGAGAGTLALFVLMGMFGTTAIQANATKRASQLPVVMIPAAIFAFSGEIAWGHAGALVVGNLIGGTLGTGLALNKGNVVVMRVLAAVVFILSIRLFFL